MNIFDIIGPVMVGPSSSHTAGAVRIGKVARELLGEEPKSVQFTLHGSFAKTGRGHGTNTALLGGVLGLAIYDERIKDSINIAKESKLEYSFEEMDLGLVHPNTARVYLEGISGSKITVLASSIGGGRIEVNSIDGAKVSFSAELNTLVVFHRDKPGIVAAISGELAKEGINIAYMKLYREGKGEQAVTVIESDQPINKNCIDTISKIENIYRAVYIAPINKG
jgi:L-serine dehydratase